MSVRSGLKRGVERALVGTGLERLTRRSRRGRSLILAYHNIVPAGEQAWGDSSLHLSQDDFAHQLDVLTQAHNVVPLETIFATPPGVSDPARVAITFDDAYAGALTAGVAELVKRGLPATIFVAPSLLGEIPWWDTLAGSAQGIVPDETRRHALEALQGKADAILGRLDPKSVGPGSAHGSSRIGTESHLIEAATKPGIGVGSHSWSHPNLSALEPSELEGELVRPLQWLRSRFEKVVPWLSYPYGLFSGAVEVAAANAGYLGAFRIDGGWVQRSRSRAYALPRLNIPAGLSLDGFRLRLAGL